MSLLGALNSLSVDSERKNVVFAEGSDKNVSNLNNNPKLAQKEADKIVEWLPSTIDKLSPQQQEEFIKLVESNLNGLNLNFAPKDPESVSETIPDNWKHQIENYKNIRKNISHLPPDKQEALRQAEKDAISKITEETRDIIDGDK